MPSKTGPSERAALLAYAELHSLTVPLTAQNRTNWPRLRRIVAESKIWNEPRELPGGFQSPPDSPPPEEICSDSERSVAEQLRSPSPLSLDTEFTDLAHALRTADFSTRPPARTMAAREVRMPRRNERGAPTFDGTPNQLRRFFEDVACCGEDARIEESLYIDYAVKYANEAHAELWQAGSVFSAPDRTWAAFKDQVFQLYPGLEEDRRFAVADLENLVSEWAKKGINTREALGDYHRSFVKISMFLIQKERISKTERDRHYFRVFSGATRDHVLQGLRITVPNRHPDDPFDFEIVYKNADYVLHGTSTGVLPMASAPVNTTPARPTSSELAAALVKSEETILTLTNTVSQIMAHMSSSGQLPPIQPAPRNMSFGSGGGTGYSGGGGGPPATTNRGPPPPMSNRPPIVGCLFCSAQGHYARECPEVEAYINRGIAARNASNQVCLANGMFVPGYVPGRNLKERMDAFVAGQNGNQNATGGATPAGTGGRDPPPHLSANMYSVFDFEETEPRAAPRLEGSARIEVWDEEEVELEAQLEVLISQIEAKKKAKADSARLATRSDTAKLASTSGPASPPKKVRFDGVVIPASSSRPGPGKDSAGAVMKADDRTARTEPPAKVDASSGGGPQFKYISGVDDPKVIERILEQMMDSPVRITSKELLAVSPDLRRHLKDMVQTKRVSAGLGSANSLEAFLQAIKSRDVASVSAPFPDSMPLRSVEVAVEGLVYAEGTLDQGAQFIAIRRDVWEASKAPMLADRSITLEAADRSQSRTLGLVPKLRIAIGDIELTVQAHVVESAPFEILIGRPFYAVTRCITTDYENGDQHLSLLDPATQTRITIPTSARVKTRRADGEVLRAEGF